MEDNINQDFQNQPISSPNNDMQIGDNRTYTLNIDQAMLKNLTGWATFRAIIEIIYGALTCLGIVTAAFGVPIIIAGVRLLNAVDHLKRYIAVNDTDRIAEAFASLNKYFKVRGIATIISIIISVILFVLYIVLIVYAFSQMGDFMNEYGNFDYNY